MLMALFNKVRSIFKTNHKSLIPENNMKPQANFLEKDKTTKKVNDFIDRKKQSMQDSQGTSDFSGSGYNGPGNVDREKRNSNMSQRNF